MKRREKEVDVTQQYIAWGVASLAAAWGVSTLSGFAHPGGWTVVGISAACAVVSADTYLRFTFSRSLDFVVAIATLIFALITIGMGLYQTVFALRMSEVNDRRCRVIEREIMRGKPRRDDLADMFQAFRCRPQSTLMPRRPAGG